MKAYKNGKYIEVKNVDIEMPLIPYEERVVSRIREVYSVDDELAILRQRDTKKDEFDAYNSFVEQVKQEEKRKRQGGENDG
ncbi:MAG: hypothetical protein Q4A86_00875 [Clostridia bacterium]|nr:hypothetical protein [Clostridia bacterium]